MKREARSLRDIPSGTWLVLILGATFAIAGLGNLIRQWSQITSDLRYGIGAFVGALLPLAALAWGMHLIRRTESR